MARTRVAAKLALLALLIVWPTRADAVRWGLGVATEFTPLVIDDELSARGEEGNGGSSNPIRLGFRPVLDLEVNHWLSFGAYAPFVVYRSGEGDGAASSGAESVFGLVASVRYPILRDDPPEECLIYAKIRGGFGTANGRAGPFFSGGAGVSFTWLDTGRGLFAELNASRLVVTSDSVVVRDVRRLTVGLSVGLVFHLGGEDWRLASGS